MFGLKQLEVLRQIWIAFGLYLEYTSVKAGHTEGFIIRIGFRSIAIASHISREAFFQAPKIQLDRKDMLRFGFNVRSK